MTAFELGRHEELIRALGHRIESLEGSVRGMDSKLDAIILLNAEKKGERKMLTALGAAAGAIVSIIVTVVAKLWHP